MSVAALSFLGWLSGYLVNPAILGFFTPFILLPIFVLPIITAIWMLIGLIKSKNRNGSNYLSCAIAVLAVLFLFSPLRPTSVDGFYYRMGKIDRDVYIAAAKLVKSESERLEISQNDLGYPVTGKHHELIESLEAKNILISISSWPIHISMDEGYVLFSWGSGLTDAYEVLVTIEGEEPHWLIKRSYPPKKIYAGVTLLID